uniref:Uncharacterized protein n=1 Tax=Anguilla anguilla TaxID=7936 RepID=A0A0E9TZ66_ANGAN
MGPPVHQKHRHASSTLMSYDVILRKKGFFNKGCCMYLAWIIVFFFKMKSHWQLHPLYLASLLILFFI